MSSVRWAPPSVTLRSTSSAALRPLNVRSTRSSASARRPQPPRTAVQSARWSSSGGVHGSSFSAAIGLGFQTGGHPRGSSASGSWSPVSAAAIFTRAARARARAATGVGRSSGVLTGLPPVLRPDGCRAAGVRRRTVAGAGSSHGPWATARTRVPSWSQAASRAAASNIRRICSTVSAPVSNSKRRRARKRRTDASPIAPTTARHGPGRPERRRRDVPVRPGTWRGRGSAGTARPGPRCRGSAGAQISGRHPAGPEGACAVVDDRLHDRFFQARFAGTAAGRRWDGDGLGRAGVVA